MDEKTPTSDETPEFGSAEWVENFGRTLGEIGKQFAEQGAVAMAALGKALKPAPAQPETPKE